MVAMFLKFFFLTIDAIPPPILSPHHLPLSLATPSFFLEIYLLRKHGHLLSRVLHHLDFAVSITMASLDMFLCPPRVKLVVGKSLNSGQICLWELLLCDMEGCWGATGLRGPPRRLGSALGEGASCSLSCGMEDSQEGSGARESRWVSAWLLGKLERRRTGGWGESQISFLSFFFFLQYYRK